MTHSDSKHYAKKHGPGATVDKAVGKAILKRAVKSTLPCAVAFDVASDLQVPPVVIGRTADLLELRLVKCQLGLFGYGPEKAKLKPSASVPEEIEKAILEGVTEGRLPCEKAWAIAETFKVHKLKISAACNLLEVKIGPCQLGAF